MPYTYVGNRMSNLVIDISHEQNYLLARASGNLVLMTSNAFVARLKTAMEELETYKVILVAENLQIIDSAGIGALMSLSRLARMEGGWIRLVKCRRLLLSLLTATNLLQSLKVFDSIEDAAQADNDEAAPTT